MTWKFATGIILVVIAILLIYSVFFWMPGRESRKEEKEDGR
jgi:protein-S-isoprenylcysteine O-methyltransferase Ste14